MIYIENDDGVLFRGTAPGLPKEVWRPKERRFVPYNGGPKPEGWGTRITEARALELMGV